VAKNPNTGSNQDKVMMFTISDPDRGRIQMFAFHGTHVSHQKAMDFAKHHKLVAMKDAKGRPLYAKESVELDEKPFLKKIKMDKFSRSERQRKKKNRKSIRKYNKNILGIESNEKTFNQFREEIANVAGSGQVAGIGSEPPVSKAAQKKKQRGATGDIARRSSVPAPKKGDLMAPALGENVETFAGCRVFEVDDDCYGKAVHGRKKWERWNRKFDMENENNATIRTYANKNPGKPVVIKNSRTGDMAYLINKKY